MNILVEGPDATGKSSLIKTLIIKNHIVLHLTKNTPDVTEGISFYNDKKNTIFDRGIISTYLYSKIFKDTNIPTLKEVESVLKKMDLIIICLPVNKERYLKHFENVKDTRLEDYNNMEQIYDAYLDFYNRICDDYNIIRYDIFRDFI